MTEYDIILAGLTTILTSLGGFLKSVNNPYIALFGTALTIGVMILRLWAKKKRDKEAFDKQIIDAQKSIGKVSIDVSKDMVDNTARMNETKQSDLDRLGALIPKLDSSKLEMVSNLSFGIAKEKEIIMTEVQHVGIEQLKKLIDEVMQTAIAGISIAKHGKELSAEIKDLEASEYIQLGSELIVKHIPAILAALKAE